VLTVQLPPRNISAHQMNLAHTNYKNRLKLQRSSCLAQGQTR